MEEVTETLYAGESEGSQNLKLVRLARKFRYMAITHPEAHIEMTGYMAGSYLIRDNKAFNAEVEKMVEWLKQARDGLICSNVWEKSIVAYFPYQVAPITSSVILLTARETARKPVFPAGMRTVSPSAVPGPQSDDNGPKGMVVINPFAKSEPVVTTQIEVSVWDVAGFRRKLPLDTKATFTVSPKGLEEVGWELTLWKQNLKKQVPWSAIEKVEFSVKVEGKLSFDEDTGRTLFKGWSTSLKSSLEVEIKIPNTPIKIGVEGFIGVDQAGKPAPGLQFKWEF